MILITGAGGKTGQAVIQALAKGAEPVRALVRRKEQGELLKQLGAQQVVFGDMRADQVLQSAFKGVRAVYHICSNMNPDEWAIGEEVIAAAKAAAVEHFVYHSVLHPQVEAMPHHWLKLRVEERLFACGIPFTILQPCAYMQNVLGYWPAISQQGVYAIPYAPAARISMVDLVDVAEAVGQVLGQPGHENAIYELAGPEALSQTEVAAVLARGLGRTVEARAVDRGEWEQHARASGMNLFAVDTLLKMFEYYENYGLVGNSRILKWLLGRPPHRFNDFVAQLVKGG